MLKKLNTVQLLLDMLAIIGICGMGVGFWYIYEPLCPIVVGFILLVAGVYGSVKRSQPP